MTHGTTVVGLGGMGQMMLTRMAEFPGFDVRCVWDPDEAATLLISERFPNVVVASNARDAINFEESTVVYVASPPDAHASLASAAINAGKAVYCEKPLGVDLASSRELVELARLSGCVNIVNFSMASTAATRAAEAWLRREILDQVISIELRVHFSQWPRRWQMGASSWLARRSQGGFTREVVSHWVYLTERLFGKASLEDSSVRYPDGELAEIHLQANLQAGDRPVSVAASIGGAGPDVVEYTLWGQEQSARITDWHRFAVTKGNKWEVDAGTTTSPGDVNNKMQLANAAAAVAGEPHSMPDFEDALSVQSLIEEMLH